MITYNGFSQTPLDIFITFVKNCFFFFQNCIIHEDNVIEYTDQSNANDDRADKGGGGVREMLTMTDKRGRGG